nr:zinc finger, CCHC-type [Tanacetum cinerariifolium]
MPGNEHKVCKLIKSLYGLKQAPKQWHQKFDDVVLSSGFHLNQSDKCVYSKFDDSGKGVIICLYVDDMLIFGTDQNQVDKTKKFLSSRFSMKDMGEADVILGGISWVSKKQTCITGSTMESEFVALAAAGKEAEWLRNLIHEIPIWPKPIALISIRCDSAPTMARAYSQIYNGKPRHLGARIKRKIYVNMKFCRFKKLGLGFLKSRITLKWERFVGDFRVINGHLGAAVVMVVLTASATYLFRHLPSQKAA